MYVVFPEIHRVIPRRKPLELSSVLPSIELYLTSSPPSCACTGWHPYKAARRVSIGVALIFVDVNNAALLEEASALGSAMAELFLSDSFARRCMASVLACDRHPDSCSAEVWAVQLTQTVLYPQGGGQPSDCGTIQVLCNSSKVPSHAPSQLPRSVVDVQRGEDDLVIHIVTGSILPIGSEVQVGSSRRALPWDVHL